MEVPAELLAQARLWPVLKRWERRELGQALRALGMSYREIGEIIPVPKGTLSAWCRDVPLTAEQSARPRYLNTASAARRRAGATLRNRNLLRVADIRTAARTEALALRKDPFWVAGVVAYWAEGTKSREVEFSNSDPKMIMLFVEWSMRFLQLAPSRFTIALHLHAGQVESDLQEFWAQITGVPLSQFRRSFIKPEGSGHRKKVLYNGTASVRVTKSGNLLHRILGWIDEVAEPFSYSDTLSSGL
jgi:hypothetical protein